MILELKWLVSALYLLNLAQDQIFLVWQKNITWKKKICSRWIRNISIWVQYTRGLKNSDTLLFYQSLKYYQSAKFQQFKYGLLLSII